jgi:preprotein translocase subunit SecB
METAPVQFAIKFISFHVINVDFALAPNCPIGKDVKKFGEISIQLGYGFGNNSEQPKNYTVFFEVKMKDTNAYLNLNLKCLALFESQETVTNEFMESNFVKINSPAIAFPFLRSFVNTFTTNAGIGPIILPAFNFTQIQPPDTQIQPPDKID